MSNTVVRFDKSSAESRRQRFAVVWLSLFAIVIGVLAIATFSGVTFETISKSFFIVDLVILVLTVLLLWLAIRGRVQLAVILFTILVLVVFSLASLLAFHRPINFTTFGYFMVLSLAGTVLGRKGALLATLGCIASLGINVLGYELNWFPGEEVNTIGNFWALSSVLALGFLLLYFTSHIFVQDLKELSQKLSDSNQELEEKRLALTKSQEILEQQVAERTAELQQTNRALQASQARLQTILDYNPAAILIFDSQTLQVIESNRTATQLLGYTPLELQQYTFRDLFDARLLPKLDDYVSQTLSTGAINIAATFRSNRGGVLETDTRLVSLPARDARNQLVLASILDITEKLRTEAQFQRLFDQASDAVFYVSQSGSILNANHQAVHLLGYAADELLKLSFAAIWAGFVPNKTLNDPHWTWQVQEQLYTHRDNSLIPVEVSAAKVTQTELVYIVRDIRMRKQQQQKLIQDKLNLEQIISAIPGTVILVDVASAAVSWVNAEAERLIGAPAQVLGQPLRPRFAQPKVFEDFYRELEKSNFALNNFVAEIIDLEERVFWATITVHPCVYQDRSASIVIIQDIDELQKAQLALQRSQKLESLGMLAGGIAHDFNNLLQIMIGQVDLIGRKTADSPAIQPNLMRLGSAIDKAAGLSRQMLVFSGKGHFEIQPVNINALILENAALFEASLPRNIKLTTQLAPNLAWIDADPSQMQQLIMNFIINASQAIGEQQANITVTTESVVLDEQDNSYSHFTGKALPAGNYVQISVSDTGPGIPKHILEKIFSPFFSTKASSGMGLAVVIGIVRGHCGGICVDTTVGVGTTFKVALPALLKANPATAQVDESWQSVSHSTRNMALIVDQDAVVRETVSELLQVVGLQTVLASNEATALTQFERYLTRVRLVLLDLSAVEDGERLFRQLRMLNPSIRILISAGFANMDTARQLVYTGWADFIQKPYNSQHLQEKVVQLLGHTGTREFKAGP